MSVIASARRYSLFGSYDTEKDRLASVPQSPQFASWPVNGPEDILRKDFKHLFDTWNHLKDGISPPKYSNFDVLLLPARAWPHIVILEQEAEHEFRYRLAGSAIDEGNGFFIAGKRLSDLDVDNEGFLAKEFISTLASGMCRFSKGHKLQGDRAYRDIHRLLCPFDDDSGKPRFIIGMVHFERYSSSDHGTRGGGQLPGSSR